MIATVSTELENLDESISTSRFAQRCAMLVNEVYVNQYKDLSVMVKQLSEENSRLRMYCWIIISELSQLGQDNIDKEKKR